MKTPLYSAADAAAKLGCDPSTIHRRAKTHAIGTSVAGRLVLTSDEVEELRHLVRDSAGNPNFTAGNRFGEPATRRKKSRK